MASNCLEAESKNPNQASRVLHELALPTSLVFVCPFSVYSKSSGTSTFLPVFGCAGLLTPACCVLFPQLVLSSSHDQLTSTLALNENVTQDGLS